MRYTKELAHDTSMILHSAITPNASVERCCADECTLNATIWWYFIEQSSWNVRIDQSTRYLHVHALWNLCEKQHFSDIAWIDPQEVQLSCDLAFRRQCGTSLLKELALRVPGEMWRFNDFAFRSEPETPCLGDVALRKPIWLLEKSVCPFEDPAWLSKGWFGGWRIHLSFNSRLDHRKSHPTDGKWMWAPQMTFDFWKSKLVIADK